MTDLDRIPRIVDLLEDAWRACPELRLMQLLMNCISGEAKGLDQSFDPYYVKDEALSVALRRYLEEHQPTP